VRWRDDGPAEDRIGQRDLTQWRSEAGRRLAGWSVRSAGRTSTNGVLAAATGIGALVVAGLTALSAEIYEEVVEQQGVTPLDRTVLEWVAVQRSPRMDEAITWFTDLGGPMWMTVLTTVAVLAVTAVWRSWSPVVLVLIAAGGSLSMTVVGKDATGRTRPPAHLAVPPLESSASLPSGHTLNAVAICGMLAYLLLRRQRSASGRVVTVCIAVSFAVAMGLSRVYLGHHWLTDVVIAWTIGLAWLIVVVTAHRLYLTVRRARQEA
jgi:membrane-associated phospholipid phosphatase